jgi:DNA-binding MarR family transcriptional regulator
MTARVQTPVPEARHDAKGVCVDERTRALADRLELLFDAATVVTNVMERQLTPLNLSLTQARSLVIVLLSQEPLTPTEIAALLLHEVQSVSTLLMRMEGKGLIERLPHPLDRRSTVVSLTPSGETAALASIDVLRAVAREMGPIPTVSMEQLRDFAIASVPMSVTSYRRRVQELWH